MDHLRRRAVSSCEELHEALVEHLESCGKGDSPQVDIIKRAFDDVSRFVGCMCCVSIPGQKHFSDLSDSVEDMPQFETDG